MSPVTDFRDALSDAGVPSVLRGPKASAAFRQATPGQVATKLERLRKDNEYTQKEAAVAAGINVSILYALEKGRWLPLSTRDQYRRGRYGRAIARLAVAYGVKVEDILLIADYENNRVLGGRT